MRWCRPHALPHPSHSRDQRHAAAIDRQAKTERFEIVPRQVLQRLPSRPPTVRLSECKKLARRQPRHAVAHKLRASFRHQFWRERGRQREECRFAWLVNVDELRVVYRLQVSRMRESPEMSW